MLAYRIHHLQNLDEPYFSKIQCMCGIFVDLVNIYESRKLTYQQLGITFCVYTCSEVPRIKFQTTVFIHTHLLLVIKTAACKMNNHRLTNFAMCPFAQNLCNLICIVFKLTGYFGNFPKSIPGHGKLFHCISSF